MGSSTGWYFGGAPARPAARSPAARLQTPPDVKIRIYGAEDLIRVASVGAVARGAFARETEYWRHRGGASFDVNALTIECAPLETLKEVEITTFLGGLTPGFSHRRPVEPTDWREGPRVTPAGRAAYLFSAPDPDDEETRIGILIEVRQEDGAVVMAGWYKSWLRPDGQIWGRGARFTLPLQRVKDGERPTTDPRFITGDPDQVWYHTVMGSAS